MAFVRRCQRSSQQVSVQMSRSIQRIKTCGVEEKNEPGCTTREKLQGCPSAGGALGSHLAVLQELNRPG